MNQAFYPLLIRVTIQAYKETSDVVVESNRLVPFVPCNGLAVELSRDADDEVMRICLDEVVYSFKESAFVVTLEDNDAVREDHSFHENLVNHYKSFGFKRV